MTEQYNFTLEDYEPLYKALNQANLVCNGAPDRYQFYQNELTKAIAEFLLKPYYYAMQLEHIKNELDLAQNVYDIKSNE